MALSIRLRRQGKRVQPFYRVVVADQRNKSDGRFIEILGYYNPISKGKYEVKFEDERCIYWLSQGANPTETVHSLMKNSGLWKKWIETKQKPNQ
ncbi:MAG: 30S ribosomal protein S16 [Candidatus Coatesbacteria bacterium]|nr:30S ribosomal protein S16 [Candidatus Coatesbacteria bacterium]